MPLLAGLGPLGLPELAIILLIVILVFGVGRLPEVGGAVGKSIKEFRKATKEGEEAEVAGTVSRASSIEAPVPPSASQPSVSSDGGAEARFCSECGARNSRSAKFCAECGNAMTAAAR